VGEDVAEYYDETTALLATPEVVGPMVDLLGELAAEGPAL
jgi:hypothetical protein